MRGFPAIAESYLRERVVCDAYAKRVRAVADGCRELDVASCNEFLRRRLSQAAPVTVAPQRSIIVSLWLFALDRGLVKRMPRGLVKIKVARKPTRAWTLEQCCTAVKGTFQMGRKRLRSGAPLGLFLRCWMLLGYETGARHADIWALREEDFTDGAVQWSQHKTGEPVSKVLSPACWEAVTQMLALSPDGTVLSWAIGMVGGCKRMKKYLLSLGMRGSGKWLRRSGATHIEMRQPGKAKLHLGHKTPGMAERFYIDWSQVRRDIPCTPALLE